MSTNRRERREHSIKFSVSSSEKNYIEQQAAAANQTIAAYARSQLCGSHLTDLGPRQQQASVNYISDLDAYRLLVELRDRLDRYPAKEPLHRVERMIKEFQKDLTLSRLRTSATNLRQQQS